MRLHWSGMWHSRARPSPRWKVRYSITLGLHITRSLASALASCGGQRRRRGWGVERGRGWSAAGGGLRFSGQRHQALLVSEQADGWPCQRTLKITMSGKRSGCCCCVGCGSGAGSALAAAAVAFGCCCLPPAGGMASAAAGLARQASQQQSSTAEAAVLRRLVVVLWWLL